MYLNKNPCGTLSLARQTRGAQVNNFVNKPLPQYTLKDLAYSYCAALTCSFSMAQYQSMDDGTDFDINDALKHYLSDPATIATPEADGALLDCENDPESLTGALVNRVLNSVVDLVAENPAALCRGSGFHSLQFLLKCAPVSLPSQKDFALKASSELFQLSRSASVLPCQSLSKLFDLIISGLSVEADVVHGELETEEQDAFQHQKKLLEMYAFLLQWSISVVETKAAEKSSSVPVKGRGAGKGAKAKATAKDGSWDSSAQLQSALGTMCKVLKLKLGKIFVTTSERDTFIGLFTRPVYLVLENEQRVKSTGMRMHAFKVLCIAVKHHGHAFGTANTSETQDFVLTSSRRSDIDHTESFLFRTPRGADGGISTHPFGPI